MARVFQGTGRGLVFDPRETAARPSDQIERSRCAGPSRGPGGSERARRFAGPGPGCGLGAACAREASRAEPVSARRTGLKMKEEEEFFSYYFPRAILNAYFDEFE